MQNTITDTAAPAGGNVIINGRKAVHIPPETAIKRRSETTTAMHLTKPLAGDLRGLKRKKSTYRSIQMRDAPSIRRCSPRPAQT